MTKETELLLVCAAALFAENGRVLVQRRPAGRAMAGLWEFPGGKLEPGETPEAGLTRELAEELGILVEPGTLAPLAFGRDTLDDGRALVLLLFACRQWHGEPRALDAAEVRWVTPAELSGLAMPPADLPLVHALLR